MLPILKHSGDLSHIFNRSQLDIDSVNEAVKNIIARVKAEGDNALFGYTAKFDNFNLDNSNLKLTQDEIDAAVNSVDKKTFNALQNAYKNIFDYHKRQIPKDDFKSSDKAGFVFRAVDSAGIYVPGGLAAYPSSVLMCAIPAIVARVKQITMVTPPGKFLNPLTIAAASICGIKDIYRVGVAQSIAALAYGTESIKKVDVIAGPGNIYVTAAKKQVFGDVGIDMIAGPSEILIIADKTANYKYIAADLLSQAEHDALSQSVLLSTSQGLAVAVNIELEKQIKLLPKKDIALKALKNYGAIVLCDNLDQAINLSNRIAPEHLELCVENPQAILKQITNAGAVFLGNYSPEPLGDYYAGTNHVLPTSSTARFSSGLGVDTYLKRISVVNYNKDDLKRVADDIILLATAENLDAHANSVRVRAND